MKRIAGLMFLITVIFTIVSAQTPTRSRLHWCGDGMMRSDSTGKMPPMMGMGMGMGMVMPRQLIPVDGGFVVVMGNKLIKFDADLNKINEVALELDEKSMQQMVNQMQQMHELMHQKMMEKQPQEE